MSEREEYRLLRLKKRIRLREIALFLECSIGHLANYENGRNEMSIKKVEKYKSYIKVKGVE